MIPYGLRLLQCLRRYRDTKDWWNLVNAGKYTSSILVTIFSTLRTFYVEQGWLVLWVHHTTNDATQPTTRHARRHTRNETHTHTHTRHTRTHAHTRCVGCCCRRCTRTRGTCGRIGTWPTPRPSTGSYATNSSTPNMYTLLSFSLSLSLSFSCPTDTQHRTTRTQHRTRTTRTQQYYYFAMVSNLLLRCSWTLSISNTNVWPVSPVPHPAVH